MPPRPNEAPLLTTYLRRDSDNEEREETTTATVAEVPEDLIRVENKLYSTEKLAELHPGGPLFIKVQNTDLPQHDNIVTVSSWHHTVCHCIQICFTIRNASVSVNPGTKRKIFLVTQTLFP